METSLETTKHQRRKSRPPRRRDARGGFTLAEFAVVCAIAALILAVITPIMWNIVPKKQLKGAARDLYSAMMRAKAEALKRGTRVAIQVNPDERHYYKLFLDNHVNGTGNGRVDDLELPENERTEKTIPPLAGPLPSRVIFLNTTTSDERMTNNLGYVANYLDHDEKTARPANRRSVVVFDHRGIPFFPNSPNTPANGHVTLCVAKSSVNEDGVGEDEAVYGYKGGMSQDALNNLRDNQCLVIVVNKTGRVRMITYGQYLKEKS